MILNLPNILSLLRILVSPVFLVLLISENQFYVQIACYLFLFGAFTDYADGWLARRLNLETTWGIFFDPLADKILTTAAFVAFSMMKIMPWYIVIIIFIRDFMTTYLRVVADKQNNPVKTSYSAKIKTFIQMLIITIVLYLIFMKSLNYPYIDSINIDELLYSNYFHFVFILLSIFTVWTLIEYIMQNMLVIKTIFAKKS